MSVIMIVEERKITQQDPIIKKKNFGENTHPMTPADTDDDDDVLYLSLTVDNRTSQSTRCSSM
jgi:hypothetical protein